MTIIVNQQSKLISTSQAKVLDNPGTQPHYPGVFYFFSNTNVWEKNAFKESQEKNNVVAFYLKKAADIDLVDSKKFYLKLAAINLTDLIDRFKDQKDIQPIVRNLFYEELFSLEFLQTDGVFDALLEVASWGIGRSNLFANIYEESQTQYLNNLLYERFETHYDAQEFGPAKICFYHYICQRNIDKRKIDNSIIKLHEIFKYFQHKTYIPNESFDVKYFIRGIETLFHLDLVLYNFLYHYETQKVFKSPESINRPQITDWTLSRPYPEKQEERWEIQETFFSIPYSNLNALPEPVHQTYDTVVKIESSQSTAFKLDMTNTHELMSKRGFENQVLKKIANVQGSERGTQQDLVSQQEDISSADLQTGVGGEHKTGHSRESEHEKSKNKSHTEQTGTEYTTSNKSTTEDGVEISLSESKHTENTTTHETVKETSQSKTSKNNSSGGVNLILFSAGGGNSDEKTNGSKNSQKSGTQSTQAEEKKQETNTSHKNTQENGHSLTNTGSTEVSTQEQSRNVVTNKSEVEDRETYEQKFGKRNEQKIGQERGNHTNEKHHGQIEEGKENSLRNTVDHQSLTSNVVSQGQEYINTKKAEKAFTETKTITISPGYLLIIKVESIKRTMIHSIKQTLQMDVRTLERLEFSHIPDHLLPLASRIQNVCNRRFFQRRYEIESIPIGNPTVKYLSLAVQESAEGTDGRMIDLNNIYYRLDYFLHSFPQLQEVNLARYVDLKKDYIEFAGALKHYASSRDSLEKMFYAFHYTSVWYEETFKSLLNEFKQSHTVVANYLPVNPPNRGAGSLFYKKEPSGREPCGLVIGNKQLTLEDSYKNLLVCGGVGSGKTSTICIPNLLQLNNCSILVTDVSGEIYEKTHQAMRNKGFLVKVFDIQNPSAGDIFNPLHHLDVECFDKIKQTVDCIMKAKGFDETKGEKDAFWVIGGKSLLELSLHILLEEKNLKKRSTVTLRDLFDQVIKLDQKFVDHLIQTTTSDRVRELALGVQSGGTSFADRAAYAKSAVEYFSAPNVSELTSSIDVMKKSSINFDDLRKNKTVIYLKIGIDQLRNYNFLLSLFYTQFFSQCYGNSKVATGEEGLPIMCLMDEFGHTPIPDFQAIIATLRKHDVSVTGMVQALSQLTELYGEDNAKTIMQGGFTSKLYFALDTSEVDVAKQISEASGKTIKNRKTQSGGKVSLSEQETEALPIQNIMYPGANRATFLHAGQSPIQLELVPYFKNQNLLDLMQSQEQQLPFSKQETSTVLSKKEAIEKLIASIKEKFPRLKTDATRSWAEKGDRNELIEHLIRKKVPVHEKPFCILIEQITANRSDLFLHLKYKNLDEENQKDIKDAYRKAIESNAENYYIDLVEFIEAVRERGFTIEELARLEPQIIELLHKKHPDLKKIIQDLILDIFLQEGKIKKEHIQKSIAEPLKSNEDFVELISCLLKNAYADPNTGKTLNKLSWIRLIELYRKKSPEFEKFLKYYSEKTSLSERIIKLQLQFNDNPEPDYLIIDDKKWKVETNEKKIHSLVRELNIKSDEEVKTIKYRTDTLEIKIFIPKTKD